MSSAFKLWINVGLGMILSQLLIARDMDKISVLENQLEEINQHIRLLDITSKPQKSCTNGTIEWSRAGHWSGLSICPIGYRNLGLQEVEYNFPFEVSTQVDGFNCNPKGCKIRCKSISCAAISKCCK